jgi:hypothetical protein
LTDPKSKKPCRSDCVLEFDLDMNCLPTKLHQSYKAEAREVDFDWRHEWVKTGADSYTVKQSTDTKITQDSVTMRLDQWTGTKSVAIHNLPESDFTLSAFGFPEPPGVEWKKPFPHYLVAGGVGMACVGVFFFLRARGRASKR